MSAPPSNRPASGEITMNAAVFSTLDALIASMPPLISAAPTRPPMRACDDDVGIPKCHERKFQMTAASSAAKTTATL